MPDVQIRQALVSMKKNGARHFIFHFNNWIINKVYYNFLKTKIKAQLSIIDLEQDRILI